MQHLLLARHHHALLCLHLLLHHSATQPIVSRSSSAHRHPAAPHLRLLHHHHLPPRRRVLPHPHPRRAGGHHHDLRPGGQVRKAAAALGEHHLLLRLLLQQRAAAAAGGLLQPVAALAQGGQLHLEVAPLQAQAPLAERVRGPGRPHVGGKAEALALARLLVAHQPHVLQLAPLGEVGPELVLLGVPVQAVHEQLARALVRARGADLFESIAAEVISAMILGATMAKSAGIEDSTGFIMFPLVIHAMDCIVSACGIMSISETSTRREDPYKVLKGGYNVAISLAVVGFGVACRVMLVSDKHPGAWFSFYMCGLIGIACAYAFVFIAQYYTDYKFPPVRHIAEASTTGHGTNIIAGIGVGMESTAVPVIVISIAIISAYWCGNASGITDANGKAIGGLFGTAVATMGMLSTAAYVLTMDVFGPIADNAGGIVEMSDQPESVRDICDELDAVGNTTKATTKGYAIGSAALASFLLFSAFMDEVTAFTGKPFNQVDIAIPEVFVAGLLGAALVYLFSAWSITAVGRSAQEVVREVRRQFAERPGIMTGEEKPDYARCVAIVAQSALREMVRPGALAVLSPVVVGIVFKNLGAATAQELLGVKAVAAFLMFATVAGILMALFLNTAGGAWDNAKKYIETGAHGGKGSEAHKAAVSGDTVGDPFKDTAGPSIHVLIKMLATITLVMAPMFLDAV